MKSESGRTLLETMALLAVMGIFTVSGMQLYAKAMNSIRVNHLMEKVYLKALELRNNVEGSSHHGKSVDLPSSETSLSYGFSFIAATTKYSKGDANIQVGISGDFSAKMCKLLKKKLSETNGLADIAGIDDCNNTLIFKVVPNFVKRKVASKKYSSKQQVLAKEKAEKRKYYLQQIQKIGQSDSSKLNQVKEKAKEEGVDLNCTMAGALTCNPLVCDEENGWFEFEDALGHCEQCEAGYYCE